MNAAIVALVRILLYNIRMKATIRRKMRHEISLGRPLVRREVVSRGLRGNTLSELAAKGVVYRVAHGVYAPSAGSSSATFDYELAARVAPKGVFTLLSALRIHDLTDENPLRMTMAIPLNDHAPKTTLPIDFVYMKHELLESDVIVKNEDASPFRVFSVERTIAECFRARNRIGVAVAVSALHDAVAKGVLNLSSFGDVLRRRHLLRVVQPYLEGLA